jgi:multidrug efflux system membrane fusion protein
MLAMKKSHGIAIVIAVLCVLWIVSGVIGGKSDDGVAAQNLQNQSSVEKALPKVRVRTSQAQAYHDTVIVTGRTQPSQDVDVSAEIRSQVIEIVKGKGDIVKRGDIVVRLEVDDLQALKAEAQQRVSQRKIEYNAATRLAKKGFNSKVRLAQARADLEAAQAALENANKNLTSTGLLAPFDGVIDARYVDVGDFVNVGDAIVRIVDLDPLEIKGFVSEREVADIALGRDTKATLLSDEIINGQVSFISSSASDETRTFDVEISVANPDFKIRGGLTVRAEIDAPKRQAHKISPSILTLNDDGKMGVKYVDQDAVVHFAPIKIISDQAEEMWVSGLPDSVSFITVGQDFVIEGQKVEAVEGQSKDNESDGLL